jgi:WD40 repeat protein
MIESSLDGNIRIWNFHSGLLLKKIKVNNYGLFGICLWNRKYLFVGSDDNTIKLIELKNGKVIMSLTCHNNYVVTIKKIYHPKYGECLISQGLKNEQIKLWKNKI